MGWVIFYVLFSACFTWGVTHSENDRIVDIAFKGFLSFCAGWFMMPIYLGSWLDLKR